MGDRSKIEWTDASWNPVTGCTKISPGCDNCYAEALASTRLYDVYTSRHPVSSMADPEDAFSVRLWPERVDQPARWTRPRMIFVNSMSDMFHVDIPGEFVEKVFQVMLATPRHTYQVLTKRPGRAAAFVRKWHPQGPLPKHIWMGTSIEDDRHRFRLAQLADVPASVRFLSLEPLLGEITLPFGGEGRMSMEHIHWVIVGGESGGPIIDP